MAHAHQAALRDARKIQEQTAKQSARISSLEVQVAGLQNELKQAKDLLLESAEREHRLQTDAEQRIAAMAALENENRQLKTKNARVSHELAGAKEELQLLQNEHDDPAEFWKTQFEELQRKQQQQWWLK